jgi:hypothetical protein
MRHTEIKTAEMVEAFERALKVLMIVDDPGFAVVVNAEGECGDGLEYGWREELRLLPLRGDSREWLNVGARWWATKRPAELPHIVMVYGLNRQVQLVQRCKRECGGEYGLRDCGACSYRVA